VAVVAVEALVGRNLADLVVQVAAAMVAPVKPLEITVRLEAQVLPIAAAAAAAAAAMGEQVAPAAPALSLSKFPTRIQPPSLLVLPAHWQQPYPALRFIQLPLPQLLLKP
jgi:hypothetical protein